MSPIVIVLALSAAILHATWNAFLRSGGDRLWTVTVMSFSGTLVAIPFAAIYPWPAAGAWLYIVLSAVLQTAYSVFLVAAYRKGELGQVYPVVRGIVPMLVTVGGFLVAGDRLSTWQMVGVTLVAMGIMSLALGRGRAPLSSLLYALLTGMIVASYATVDARGVREAGHAGAYAAWVVIIFGTFLPLTFVIVRRGMRVDFRAPDTLKALAGGLVALVSYALVVTAFSLGPAGPVTALRETSVVFAALIGWLFLGEVLTARRLAACIIVALGAVCLGYFR